MRQPIEFEAARRAMYETRDRYRLNSREVYVLRSVPIRGLRQAVAGRRRVAAGQGGSWMMWMVHDEDLSNVVERLLQRGLLTRRGGAGPVYAELTAEGRAALEASKPLR